MKADLLQALKEGLGFAVGWRVLGHGVQLPRARVLRVGGEQDYTLDGPDLMDSRIQVDVFAECDIEAEDCATQVRACLADLQTDIIQAVDFVSVVDGLEQGAELVPRVTMIFNVQHLPG